MWRGLCLICVVGCTFPRGVLPDAGPGDAPKDAPRDMSMGDVGDMMINTPSCPTSYNLHDSARPASHYRLVTTSRTFNSAELDCEDDASGTTLPAHVIVLDTDGELVWAFAQSNSDQWTGITDEAAEGTWLPITSQTTLFFGSAAGNQQNKNCLVFNGTDTTADQCTATHPYLCECDGLAGHTI